MPFATTWMNLEIIILSEVSQTEKDKYVIPLTSRILKKENDIDELTYETETDSETERIYGYQWGRVGVKG